MLAHDILSIHITNVASESVFSVGSRVWSLSETVSSLKVFKHWFVFETGYVALLSLKVKGFKISLYVLLVNSLFEQFLWLLVVVDIEDYFDYDDEDAIIYYFNILMF